MRYPSFTKHLSMLPSVNVYHQFFLSNILNINCIEYQLHKTCILINIKKEQFVVNLPQDRVNSCSKTAKDAL